MTLIWRGGGLLVLIFTAVSIMVMTVFVRFTGHDMSDAHPWFRFMAFGLAAIAVHLFAVMQDRVPEERGQDSLFMVPMHYWSFILIVTGLAFSNSREMSTATDSAIIPVLAAAPSPQRVARPQASTPASQPALARTYKLQAIFFNAKGKSTAMIDGQTVFAGDKVGSYTVAVITETTVTLQSPDGPRRLFLDRTHKP